MTTSGVRRWPSLLSPREVAAMLGSNEQTVRAWLRQGVLRGRRMEGGSYVLARGDVLVDIARHRQAVAAARARRVLGEAADTSEAP